MASSTDTAGTSVFGPIAAETYERTMGRWSRRLAPLFLDFVGHGAGDGSSLDVGCGTGSLTFALAERGLAGEVVGCDIAEPLLAYARAVNPHSGPHPLRGERRLRAAVRRRHLRPGAVEPRAHADPGRRARGARDGAGRAAGRDGRRCRVGLPRRGGAFARGARTAAALDAGAAAFRDRFHAGVGLRPGELAGLRRRMGLHAVREAELTIRMDFANFADFWGPFEEGNTLGAHLRSLPRDRQALIREKVEAAYRSGEPDGPRSFAATAGAAAGTR